MRSAAFAILVLCAPAAAQLTDQLALARVCVVEAGLQVTPDCAAIAQVLRRGAAHRGVSLATYARAYSPHAFDGDGRHPWIAELDADGTRPTRWPSMRTVRRGGRVVVLPAAAWEGRSRRRWLELYEHSGRVLSGVVPSPCARPPDHWGCPEDRGRQCRDHERAVRAGWRLVACPGARNEFWEIPAS